MIATPDCCFARDFRKSGFFFLGGEKLVRAIVEEKMREPSTSLSTMLTTQFVIQWAEKKIRDENSSTDT